MQRDAYTEAQWGRIENPAPPSADGEEGCGATTQGNATENATGSLGNAATLPNEEGSGPSGATPCFPGGCLSDGDCGGHGDCVRGVCECSGGYLGASLAEPCKRPRPHPANGPTLQTAQPEPQPQPECEPEPHQPQTQPQPQPTPPKVPTAPWSPPASFGTAPRRRGATAAVSSLTPRGAAPTASSTAGT